MTFKKNIKWLYLFLLLAFFIVTIFMVLKWTNRFEGDAQANTTLQKIIEQGYVRIGFANEAPFGYQDEQGNLTGQSPELARRIFKQLGIKRVEGVLTEFGALIPGLKAGRFDVIAAGMYILPKRCEQIAFSTPTYKLGEGFLVKQGNPLGLLSYEEVAAHPKAKLGVMAGAVQSGYARQFKIPTSRVVVFPDYPSALAGLKSGRVDAIAATTLTINDLLKKSPPGVFQKATPFKNPVIQGRPVQGYGAFGFRLKDEALKQAFDQEIQKMKKDGRLLKAMQPFGFTRTELPGGVSVEQLCQAK